MDKLRKMVQASYKAVRIDQEMQNCFKQKFREHDINYENYKKHKADMGSLGYSKRNAS